MREISLQNTLGNALQNIRKARGMTQGEAAARAGISVPTLRLLERGRGNVQSWNAVLAALGVELVGRNLPSGEDIGARIAMLRKRRGLGQRGLAALVGCTQAAIVALERKGRGRVRMLDRALLVLGGGAYLAPLGSKRAFYTHAGNSSGSNRWETPRVLLARLYKVVGTFDVDPCSPAGGKRGAPVKARVRYTVQDDGLVLPWFGTVFVNPPYGRELALWVAKAAREVEAGHAEVVMMLLPARTDTAYWHTYIADTACIFFLRGRLRFSDGEQAAPFPSALVVWGGTPDLIAALREALPEAWHVG